MTSEKKIMTEKEVMGFAAWYAYELHKYVVKNSRSTEPTIKDVKRVKQVNYAK